MSINISIRDAMKALGATALYSIKFDSVMFISGSCGPGSLSSVISVVGTLSN